MDFRFVWVIKANIPYNIGGKDVLIGPITVGDEIEKNRYLEGHEDIHKNIMTFALMIKSNEMDLEEKIDAIRFADPIQIKEISELERELFISIKPVIKKCPKCGHENKVYVGLDKIRAFP